MLMHMFMCFPICSYVLCFFKKNHVLFVNFEVKLISDNEFHAEGEFFGFLSRVFALERIQSISFFDILFIHHFENHQKKVG